MEQRSIASFFGGKPAVPKEKKMESFFKKDDGESAKIEVEGEGAASTPSKQIVDKSDSPPTRKRLRQVDSDDEASDDEGNEHAGAKDADHSALDKDEGGEPAAAGEEGKKTTPASSPVKRVPAAKSPAKKVTASPAKKGGMASLFGAAVAKKPHEEKEEDTSPAKGTSAAKEAKSEQLPKDKIDSKARKQGEGSSGKVAEAEDEEEEVDEKDMEEEKNAAVMSLGTAFDATKEATWKKGEPVPYAHLAQAFEKIEATSKRLEITAILTRALRTVIEVTPSDLLACVYMCVNKLAPAHEGVELGLGEMVLKKALAEATGRQEKDIKADYEKAGDLGIVAMKSRSTQRTMFAAKALTVQGVFKALLAIAKMEGNKSGSLKKDKIKSLLVASKGVEAQYVIRHLQGKMRIGLAEQTVLVALAHAVALSPPPVEGREPSNKVPKKEELDRAVEIIKEVFCQLPCYDKIIPHLLTKPIEDLPKYCYLAPGIPIKPMLAHPTKGISEVLDRFANQNFTCEYKYDGERGQIHKLEDGSIKIFSRNSECNTSKYPDIIRLIPDVIVDDSVKTFVLDCEVVAYDRESKKILPFQVLSTRKRKEADEGDIKVQVCLFAFDMMYLNGTPLLNRPLIERREALKKSFKEVEGSFMFATAKDASDTEEILAFLNESVAASCEGLMVKTLDEGGPGATYEPDKRSHKWLKVKKDYIKGMTDSFDLVPIGAFYGKGKRTGVYGAFLLACYNAETEDYETICKIGTGFSDEQLKDFHAELSPHVIPGPKSYYQWEQIPKDTPDVWLDVSTVWEVSAADLSISPVHKAAVGIVDDAKGIALRFPRLVRVRDDKTPENATTSTQIAQMYQNQAVIGGDSGAMYDD